MFNGHFERSLASHYICNKHLNKNIIVLQKKTLLNDALPMLIVQRQII